MCRATNIGALEIILPRSGEAHTGYREFKSTSKYLYLFTNQDNPHPNDTTMTRIAITRAKVYRNSGPSKHIRYVCAYSTPQDLFSVGVQLVICKIPNENGKFDQSLFYNVSFQNKLSPLQYMDIGLY